MGYGESYQAKVVTGDQLYPYMMKMMYGEKWTKDASAEHQQDYWNDLCNIDGNWKSDGDLGPTMWSTDVGETDHIEIFRITE